MEIPLEVTPLLGSAELTQEGYHSLNIGDVIVLDQAAEEPIAVKVGDQILFKACPGLFHNHKAIKIDG